MTSKLISIKEDVYNKLKRLKGPEESFSDLIERLIAGQKKDPLRNFGLAKNIANDILDEFEGAVNEAKKEDAAKSSKRFKELWGEKS